MRLMCSCLRTIFRITFGPNRRTVYFASLFDRHGWNKCLCTHYMISSRLLTSMQVTATKDKQTVNEAPAQTLLWHTRALQAHLSRVRHDGFFSSEQPLDHSWFLEAQKNVLNWTIDELQIVIYRLIQDRPKIPSQFFCSLCNATGLALNSTSKHFAFESKHKGIINLACCFHEIFTSNLCSEDAANNCQWQYEILMRICCSHSAGSLRILSIEDLVRIICALPTITISLSDTFLHAWLKTAGNKLDRFSADNLSTALERLGQIASDERGRSLVHARFFTPNANRVVETFINLFARELLIKGLKFSEQDLVRCGRGLMNISYSFHGTSPGIADCWNLLDPLFVTQAEKFTAEGLSMYGKFRSFFEHLAPSSSFYIAWCRACKAKLLKLDFGPKHLVELAAALNGFGMHDEELLRLFQNATEKTLHFDADDLAALFKHYAALGLSASQSFWCEYLDKLPKITDADLIQVLYTVSSCSIHQRLPLQIVHLVQRAVFDRLKVYDTSQAKTSFLRELKLYQFICGGENSVPDTMLTALASPEWTNQLEKISHLRPERQKNTSEKFAFNALYTWLALHKLDYQVMVNREVYIPHILTCVDFCMKAKNNNIHPVLIQLDGPSHYYITEKGDTIREEKGLNTHSKMNSRLLERCCYRVIRLPFYKMDRGKQAALEYLDEKLEFFLDECRKHL